MDQIRQDFEIANLNIKLSKKNIVRIIVFELFIFIAASLTTTFGLANAIIQASTTISSDVRVIFSVSIAALGIVTAIRSGWDVYSKSRLLFKNKKLSDNLQKQNDNINAAINSELFFDFGLGLKVDIATLRPSISASQSRRINAERLKASFEKTKNTANELIQKYPEKDAYEIYLIRARANYFIENYKLALADIIYYLTYNSSSILAQRLQAFIYRELAFREINTQSRIKYFNKAEDIYLSMYRKIKDEGQHNKRFITAIILIDWARLKYRIGMTFSKHRGEGFFTTSNKFIDAANQILSNNREDVKSDTDLLRIIELYRDVAITYKRINELKLYKSSIDTDSSRGHIKIILKENNQLIKKFDNQKEFSKLLNAEIVIISLSAYKYLAKYHCKFHYNQNYNKYKFQDYDIEYIFLFSQMNTMLNKLNLITNNDKRIEKIENQQINVPIKDPEATEIIVKETDKILELHCLSNAKMYESIALVWLGKFEYKRAIYSKNKIALDNAKLLFEEAIKKDSENYVAINSYIKTYLHANKFRKEHNLKQEEFSFQALEDFVKKSIIPEGSLADNVTRCHANITYAKVMLQLHQSNLKDNEYLIKAKEHLYRAKQYSPLNPDIYFRYKKVKKELKSEKADSKKIKQATSEKSNINLNLGKSNNTSNNNLPTFTFEKNNYIDIGFLTYLMTKLQCKVHPITRNDINTKSIRIKEMIEAINALSPNEKLFIPININNNHFTLLAIMKGAKDTLFGIYVDSLGDYEKTWERTKELIEIQKFNLVKVLTHLTQEYQHNNNCAIQVYEATKILAAVKQTQFFNAQFLWDEIKRLKLDEAKVETAKRLEFARKVLEDKDAQIGYNYFGYSEVKIDSELENYSSTHAAIKSLAA